MYEEREGHTGIAGPETHSVNFFSDFEPLFCFPTLDFECFLMGSRQGLFVPTNI